MNLRVAELLKFSPFSFAIATWPCNEVIVLRTLLHCDVDLPKARILVLWSSHISVDIMCRTLACYLKSRVRWRTWQPSTGLSWFLPQPESSEGFSSLSAVCSDWCLPIVEDAVVVDVNATDELRSRLVGPVPGVLVGLWSCHNLAFLAGFNHLYSSAE